MNQRIIFSNNKILNTIGDSNDKSFFFFSELNKKANKENILEFIKIIDTGCYYNGFFKQLSNGWYATFKSDNNLYIYDIYFNYMMDIKGFKETLYNICERITNEKKGKKLEIIGSSSNELDLIKIDLNKLDSSIQRYNLEPRLCYNMVEMKESNYFFLGENGIIQYLELFNQNNLIKNNIKNKAYIGCIKINENICAFTSNSILPKGEDKLFFYNIKTKKISNEIEGYSFVMSTNGLAIMEKNFEVKNTKNAGDKKKKKKKNKNNNNTNTNEVKNKVLICACKQYCQNQSNGILLVNADLSNNIDIKNPFYETFDFEVNCICPLSIIDNKNTKSNNIDEEYKNNIKVMHTDYFLVGGFDKEAREGKIKMYKLIYNDNVAEISIEYLQDIEFEDNFEGFNGPISCITQSKISGNIIINCFNEKIYLFSRPNVDYYLEKDSEKGDEINNQSLIIKSLNNEKEGPKYLLDNINISNDPSTNISKKEAFVDSNLDYISPIKINELFKRSNSVCKILSETKDNEKMFGTGFFCKLNEYNFLFKYALFTNNHILDESKIDIGKSIKFEYLYFNNFNSKHTTIKKEIKITDERRVYTNKELDYTCIEIYESDGIKDFFEIDPEIFKYNNNEVLKNNDIFILQYPKGGDLSFSLGTIISIKDKIIMHNASTENGSSGSPIIRRHDNSFVIGIHKGSKNRYNVAINFVSIANDIKKQAKKEISEINSISIVDNNEDTIYLFHDYNDEKNIYDENKKKLYLETKNMSQNLFKESIEIYANVKKTIKHDYKYKINELKKIKAKFKSNNRIKKNTSFMFFKYFWLNKIDLSSFDTNNVPNKSGMLKDCFSLISIDLSNFNGNNIFDMSHMFSDCSSLENIDLSKFKTYNVTNMSHMFLDCSSLENIDLSKFKTHNVTNMSDMFRGCSSLEIIDSSKFNTYNVTNMGLMFSSCSSLISIDLSKFITNNVTNMSFMFDGCSSLDKNSIKSKDEKLYKAL